MTADLTGIKHIEQPQLSNIHRTTEPHKRKDDTAHHAEQLARLGWQYFECPACGSEGARAFPVSSPIYVAEVDMPDPEDSPGYTELAQPDVDRRSTES